MITHFDSGNVRVNESTPDEQVIDWGEYAIHAESAWKKTKGEGVKVAVIDTGWGDHPDLMDNIVLRGSMTTPDRDGNVPIFASAGRDMHGHAQHVAGIIGALDNGTGVVGVAPGCSLMMAQVIPGYVDDLVAGIEWCVASGADIINMSIGGPTDHEEIHTACKRAAAAGVILVAAAGNTFAQGMDTVAFPARYPEVIAVAALDKELHKAVFSAAGPELINAVALPGVEITSCWKDGFYAIDSGTSMAAPMLSGIIALMLALKKPKREEARNTVFELLKKISDKRSDFTYAGLGMPDL